jgi:hypothetical protein
MKMDKLSATAEIAWQNAIRMEREYMIQNAGHYLVDEFGQAYVKRPGAGRSSTGCTLMYNHFIRTEFFHRELERLKAEERSKMTGSVARRSGCLLRKSNRTKKKA